MANYDNLIASIKDAIKNNNKQAITGQVLQDAMLEMVSQLGKNTAFGGVATPSTNPGTPTTNTFYIATEAGTYSNMGGVVVAEGEVAIISYNGQAWSSSIIDDVRKLPWYYARFNAEDMLVGFIHKGKGGILDESSAFSSTDFLPVTEGEEIEVHSGFYGNACIGGYSDNKGNGFVILAETSDRSFQYFHFTIPQGVRYMRVSMLNASTDYCEIRWAQPRLDVLDSLLQRTDLASSIQANATKIAENTSHLNDISNDYLSVYENPDANDNTRRLTKAIRALYLPYLEQGYVISNVGYMQTAQTNNPATFVRVHTFDLSANFTFVFNDIPESGICSSVAHNGGVIVVDWNVLNEGFIKTGMTGENHRVNTRCYAPSSFGLSRHANIYTGFELQSYKSGYFINGISGKINATSSANSVVTDYIPVMEGDVLRVVLSPIGNATWIAGYSDTEGNGFVPILTKGGKIDDVFTFTVPQGVRFMVVGSSIQNGSKVIAVDYSESVNLSRIAKAMRYSMMDNPETLNINAYTIGAQETATRWLKLTDNATFPSDGAYIGLQNGKVVISNNGVVKVIE